MIRRYTDEVPSSATLPVVLNLFDYPSIGDLDGDGGLDVVKGGLTATGAVNLVLAGQNLPFEHVVQAWSMDASPYRPGFPATIDDYQLVSSPAIADLDGVAGAEVLATTGLYLMRAYDGAGGQIEGWQAAAVVAEVPAADAVEGAVALPAPADAATVAVVAFDEAGNASTIASTGVAQVVRVDGPDRISTAVEVSRESCDTADVVVVARSDVYADALAGAPLAVRTQAPLLLSERDRLSPVTAARWPDALSASALGGIADVPVLLTAVDALPEVTADALADVTTVTVIGGAAAVSDDVAAAVTDLGPAVDRIAGATRFETAAAVAQAALGRGATPSTVWLATGAAFPDGLVSGAAAAAGGVLLLVDPIGLPLMPPRRPSSPRGWRRSTGSSSREAPLPSATRCTRRSWRRWRSVAPERLKSGRRCGADGVITRCGSSWAGGCGRDHGGTVLCGRRAPQRVDSRPPGRRTSSRERQP